MKGDQKKLNNRKIIFLTIFLIVVTGLLGCASPASIQTPEVDETSTVPPTSVPQTTPDPTPTALPPVGLLVVPPEADQNFSAAISPLVSDALTAAGYRFQTRPSISVADFERDQFAIVVVVAPFPEISDIVKSQPQTRFLAVNFQGLNPAPNLSVIGSDGVRLDQQGFVAGYTAALITPDWRVGVIGRSDTPETIDARQAFLTGVQFFCGLCLPIYAPFYEYPLFFELGADADAAAWRAAAEFMVFRQVETIYIVPGAGDNEMLRYLTQSGVNIISGTPLSSEFQSNWVVSFRMDPLQAFIDFWPVFMAGADSQMVTIPMTLADINPNLLSAGRQRLVEEVLTAVGADYYDLGTTDETP